MVAVSGVASGEMSKMRRPRYATGESNGTLKASPGLIAVALDTTSASGLTVCRWMNGDCRFGDRCNFAHGETELRKLSAAQEAAMGGRGPFPNGGRGRGAYPGYPGRGYGGRGGRQASSVLDLFTLST